MPPLSFAPIAPQAAQSATDQVFETLYDAVISLRLPPGTKVSEAEVAKQLDVSRQPVRDAFFRLSQLGFLLIRPQRATLITRISERAVLDAMFVRIALEVECLRLVQKNITAEALERLKQNLASQYAAMNTPEAARFHALDEGFHALLCDIAGHEHAWGLIQEQKAHMDRVRFLTLSEKRRRQVYEEHLGVVCALEEGNLASAEDRLRTHLSDIKRVLHSIRNDSPEYFEVTE